MARMVPNSVRERADALGLTVDEDGWKRLDALMGLWRRYSRSMNLTGAKDEEGLARQVIDGLETVAAVERASGGLLGPGVRWLDIGSGGGFPALIVGAVRPVALTLVEPRQKRASFLSLASSHLRRGQVQVRRARIEGSTWDENGLRKVISEVLDRYDVSSARAVWAPGQWLEVGRSCVRPGGWVVLHASKESERLGEGEVCAEIAGELGVVRVLRREIIESEDHEES